MLYSVVFLQFCLIILEHIAAKLTCVIPLLGLAIIQYQSTLHAWPLGIEYRVFELMSWTGAMQVFVGLFASGACFIAPEAGRGIVAIMISVIQILRAADWFNMYVGIEILLIGTMLLGEWKRGYDYLTWQILASTAIMIGICQVYTQQVNFGINTDLTGLAPAILLVGFAMKAGFWPFVHQIQMYRNAPRLIFLVLTCLSSKAVCYCMSLMQNILIYDAISLLSLCFVVYRTILIPCARDDFNVCVILSSNAILLLCLKYTPPWMAIIYTLWSILVQFGFAFRPDICLWSFVPLGPDFLLKIMLMKHFPLWINIPLGLAGCAINACCMRVLMKSRKKEQDTLLTNR